MDPRGPADPCPVRYPGSGGLATYSLQVRVLEFPEISCVFFAFDCLWGGRDSRNWIKLYAFYKKYEYFAIDFCLKTVLAFPKKIGGMSRSYPPPSSRQAPGLCIYLLMSCLLCQIMCQGHVRL